MHAHCSQAPTAGAADALSSNFSALAESCALIPTLKLASQDQCLQSPHLGALRLFHWCEILSLVALIEHARTLLSSANSRCSRCPLKQLQRTSRIMRTDTNPKTGITRSMSAVTPPWCSAPLSWCEVSGLEALIKHARTLLSRANSRCSRCPLEQLQRTSSSMCTETHPEARITRSSSAVNPPWCSAPLSLV
jgi:hypothetical protein